MEEKTWKVVSPRKLYMPNIKSAAKAMRQSLKRRAYNLKTKDKFKDAIKQIKKLIVAGNKKDAMETMKQVMSALDKATKKHVIHKNTASRKKSRLAKMIGKLK